MNFLEGKRIVVAIGGGAGVGLALEALRMLRQDGAEVIPLPVAAAHEFITPHALERAAGCAPMTLKGVLARKPEALVILGAGAAASPEVRQGAQAWPSVFSDPGDAPPGEGPAALTRLVETLQALFAPKDLDGLRILITAGPTVEDIDPVRFISNRSSGRMGVALARAAAQRGARVELVHGPLRVPIPALDRIVPVAVRSAREMFEAALARAPASDLAILCAAVADFAPVQAAPAKIKKERQAPILELALERTPDILAALGAMNPRPLLVGFAAETDNLEANALEKLRKKNCDFICANQVGAPGAGFDTESNEIVLYSKEGARLAWPRQSKDDLAHRILDAVVPRA